MKKQDNPGKSNPLKDKRTTSSIESGNVSTECSAIECSAIECRAIECRAIECRAIECRTSIKVMFGKPVLIEQNDRIGLRVALRNESKEKAFSACGLLAIEPINPKIIVKEKTMQRFREATFTFLSIEAAEIFSAQAFQKSLPNVIFYSYKRKISRPTTEIVVSLNKECDPNIYRKYFGSCNIDGLFSFKPTFCGTNICRSGILEFATEETAVLFLRSVQRIHFEHVVEVTLRSEMNEWTICKTCGRSITKAEKCCKEKIKVMDSISLSQDSTSQMHSNWKQGSFALKQHSCSITETSHHVADSISKLFNDPSNFSDIKLFGFATSPFMPRAHCFSSAKDIMQLFDPLTYIVKPKLSMAIVLHSVLDNHIDKLGSEWSKAETKDTFIHTLGMQVSGTPDSIFQGCPVEMKSVENFGSVSSKISKWLRQIAIYQSGNNSIAYLVVVSRSTKEIACFEVSVQNIQDANSFWSHEMSKSHTNQILDIVREYKQRITSYIEDGRISKCTAFQDVLPRAMEIFECIDLEMRMKQMQVKESEQELDSELEQELDLELDTELDPELDPELDTELDPELDPELDLELDSELDEVEEELTYTRSPFMTRLLQNFISLTKFFL